MQRVAPYPEVLNRVVEEPVDVADDGDGCADVDGVRFTDEEPLCLWNRSCGPAYQRIPGAVPGSAWQPIADGRDQRPNHNPKATLDWDLKKCTAANPTPRLL